VALLTEHLGANLRRIRRERDFTQAQIAALARVSQPYISALERGLRPTRLDHVELLARALAVSPETLLAMPPRASVRSRPDRVPSVRT
jgi:transcriptional regulator with XRE-family HTH domain